MTHSLGDRIPELDDYTETPEITVLRNLRCKLMHDIVPKNLIPYLKCLSRRDESRIKAEEKNVGDIDGAMMLLDLIVKKENWYEDLLTALKNDEVKQGHLASMLNKELQKYKHEKGLEDETTMTFGDSYSEGGSSALGDLKTPPSTETQSGLITQPVNTVDNVTRGLQRLNVQGEPSSANQHPSTPPPPYSPPGVPPSTGHGEDRQTGINQQSIIVNVYGGGTFQLGDHNALTTGRQASQTNEGQPRQIEDDGDEQRDGATSGKSHDEKQLTDHSAAVIHSETHIIEEDPEELCDDMTYGNYNSGKRLTYKELTPRGYQEELAEPAQRGQNCIICAPTGTGKTYVAIMIAKHHMESSLTEQAKSMSKQTRADPSCKLRKTLFVVNQIHQLNQTYKRLKTFLPLFNIAKRSGVSTAKIKFEDLIQTNDIIITTGGILKNSLEEKKTSLSMFSLIVVDECHHAMKDHPYNMIMVNYLRMKNDHAASASSIRRPQIIGLTASPGTGGKSELEAAKRHILTLCANLDAQRLVTVQDPKNKEELQKVSNNPGKITKMMSPRNPDPFKATVEGIMSDIETKSNLYGRCQDRGTQPYENIVMDERSRAINGKMQDVALCCDHLIVYNTALRMSNDCRMKDGLKIIDDFYNERVRRRQHENTEIELWLYGVYRRKASKLFELSEEEEKYPNPKLVMLKDTLQASEMDDNSDEFKNFRGMIFVKMRNLAKAICEYIGKDSTLKVLKAAVLTGVQGKCEGGQMTQAEQDATIQRFANGDCKLLVATSVAEEGLDIEECHMVINYNHATNEISLRQSSGRARKMESTRHFIGDVDVGLRDKVNVFLDEQMEKAIEEIQNDMSMDDFLNEVGLIQNAVLHKRSEKEEAQKQKKSLNEASSVNLYCKGCVTDNLLCQGSEVYKFKTNHILIDAQIIKSKIEFREHHDIKKREMGMKKIYCKSCKQDWGNTLPHPKCFPVIKIESFIVEYSNGSRKTIKKWIKTDFPVQSITILPKLAFTVTCVENQ
ncbi:ATP-dependent RNA helicase DHX58-like [Glandiceps talaboti]